MRIRSLRLIRSLNTRLLLALLLAGIVPLVLSVLLLLRVQRQALLNDLADQDVAAVEQVAHQFSTHFHEIREVNELMARMIEEGDQLHSETLLPMLAGWQDAYGHFEQIAVRSLDGGIDHSVGNDPFGNEPLTMPVVSPLDTDEEQTWILSYSSAQKQYYVEIYTPIYAPEGATIAFLCTLLPVSEINHFGLPAGFANRPEGNFVVVDEEGVVVYAYYAARDELALNQSVVGTIWDMPIGETASQSVRYDDGRDARMLSSAHIAELDWQVIFDQPVQSPLGLREFALALTLFTFVVMAIVCGLLAWGLTWSLTQPLKKLNKAAEGMAGGDFTRALPASETQDPELGLLIQSFEQMRQAVLERESSLRTLSSELEVRVEQRTAALLNMNKRLEYEIEEHRQTEIQLREARDVALRANRAKSSFLANMSHELRTPLSSIIGYSELLIDHEKIREAENVKPFLDKILSSGAHVLNLVNDILNLAKIEAGHIDLMITDFAVSTMIEDVVDIVRPSVEQNENSLTIEHADRLGIMASDEIKVRQILINLLSNAAKFTTAGEVRLVVTRREEEDAIYFTVHDTGIGMNEEQQARLFQPFTQVHAEDQYFGGTGLGLSLSWHFCNVLGGRLSVESEAGVGSTFTVCLPMTQKQA